MPHEIEANWDQVHLLPACIEDWIGAEHPARFIREFVEGLDLSALGFASSSGGTEGRPRYATKLMLRVWLYGYYQKVRSTRALELACRERMGFVWLCGTHRPDHNSLWRFWDGNRSALSGLFKQSVRVAIKLQMVGFVTEAIDGPKIQSCSGTRSACDEASLKRQLAALDKQICELEEQLAHFARSGPDDDLPAQLRSKSALRAKVRSALRDVQNDKARHIHPNEPDARRMNVDARNRFAYNAQAVVDEKEQIITGADVVNEPNDKAQLNTMIEHAEQVTGQACEQSLADGGYYSGEQIRQAQDKNVIMPLPRVSENKEDNPYHVSCFEYDSQRDEVVCPQKRRIPFQRERIRGENTVRIYRSAQTCKGCPVREQCTKDRNGRTIEIAPWHDAVNAHREKMSTQAALQAYQQRARIVEPVFAWIKNNDGLRRWSFRGLDKVKTQWSMLCTSRNLRAIFRKWKESRQNPSPTDPNLVPNLSHYWIQTLFFRLFTQLGTHWSPFAATPA